MNSYPMKLSRRQSECAALTLQGMSAKEISETLGLSTRTIEYYLQNLKNKLGCRNKVELVLKLASQRLS